MIVIETDKIYKLYARTNRRVKWKYAEYGGCYRTVEEAIESAKKHYGSKPFEYQIINLDDDSTITGFVNWKGKS